MLNAHKIVLTVKFSDFSKICQSKICKSVFKEAIILRKFLSTISIWQRYEERIKRVNDYVHQHLDDTLNMEKLAEVACLSPYHWHRIYRAIHNETIASTVKKLRLQRATNDLVNTAQSMKQIAVRAGYSNIQSFNRAFKHNFGVPPGQYRNEGIKAQLLQIEVEQSNTYDCKIVKVDPINTVGIEYTGPYQNIGKTFERLNSMASGVGIQPHKLPSYGVYYDDPCVVPQQDLRSFAALPLPSGLDCKLPLRNQTIPGGTYAVFRVSGPFINAVACYDFIFGEWLRTSNRELGNHPGYTKYINPFEPDPANLETEIYLPLI